jgi:RHS repeat-associated protein
MDLAADPRFAMLAPVVAKSTVTLPSGLTRTTTNARTATQSNPLDPLSLVSRTDTTTVDGRTWTSTYQVATRTDTVTSPTGRIVRATHDARGRVISIEAPEVLPVTFGYDAQGRLTTTAQGTRTATVTYGADGFVQTATNPIDQTVTLGRDPNGRVIQVQRPDLAVSTYGYSPAGQATRVTPPGKPDHLLAFNDLELPASYTPPPVPGAADATTFGYDLDKAVTSVVQPGARQIVIGHDAAGRVDTVTFPTGVITTTYDATTGHVTSITGPTGVDLGFAYDGARLTGVTFSGAVNHSLAWGHDSSFRLTSETIDGANAVSYAYDDDDLVTEAGALHIARAPASGRVTATTAGNVGDTLSYNAYGEIQAYIAAANGNPLIAYSYVRDDLGRIAEKTETRGGVSHVFAYQYDDAGRLTTVTEDGVIVETYDWDDNGNRVGAFNGDGASTATYDNQDRIETSSRWIFEHEPSGEVKRKTDVDTLDTTLYEHDALGNLRSVDLPDGRHLEYLVDAQGRRIQKKVDGVAQKGWIWRSGLQPVAELDGAGNIVARYVYAGGGNAPELIEKGGATYRVVKDHLGSVRLVVDVATGAVVQELEYDSWGRVLVDTNPGWQPFGYAGGLYDADTGLVRFGAREYDADTGRWLSKDPIGLNGGLALYGYVGGDPINAIDPTGLSAFKAFLKFNFPGYGAADDAIPIIDAGVEDLRAGRIGCAAFAFYNAGQGAAATVAFSFEGAAAAEKALVPQCFEAGTSIDTPDGPVSIEDIEAGDEVLSRNEATGAIEAHRVAQTFEHTADTVVEVHLASAAGVETIVATPEHPFRVQRGGWVGAGELRAGDEVVSEDGEGAVVVNVLGRTEPTLVYNFEVEGAHTYFVGDVGVLVHNDCVRPVRPEDLGLSGANIAKLEGTVTTSGSTRLIDVKYIEATSPGALLGEIRGAVPNALANAQAAGISTLQFNASFANAGLARFAAAQTAKYGGLFSSAGGSETLTFLLP